MKEIIETLIERGWKQPIYRTPSLADIINDNEAMRLLFGEGEVGVFASYDSQGIHFMDSPMYKERQKELIIMETEEEQIAYIKKHMI